MVWMSSVNWFHVQWGSHTPGSVCHSFMSRAARSTTLVATSLHDCGSDPPSAAMSTPPWLHSAAASRWPAVASDAPVDRLALAVVACCAVVTATERCWPMAAAGPCKPAGCGGIARRHAGHRPCWPTAAQA
ncbi:hypothetical protein HaLaN_10168 [Haematococcus lacustris]|uniref:Uncharacterized protein n=1 Tax=Haematococcus lacustris TaxID=44745 RepID=A0A699Z4G2_HAELA|nr:hypothetical protein HaLaN_10168 [Haematococcus lacustris]